MVVIFLCLFIAFEGENKHQQDKHKKRREKVSHSAVHPEMNDSPEFQ